MMSFLEFHTSKLSPRALHTLKITQPFILESAHFGSTGFDQIFEAFHGFPEDGNLGQRTFIVRTLGTLYLILSGAVFVRFSHTRLQLMHGANLKGDKR